MCFADSTATMRLATCKKTAELLRKPHFYALSKHLHLTGDPIAKFHLSLQVYNVAFSPSRTLTSQIRGRATSSSRREE